MCAPYPSSNGIRSVRLRPEALGWSTRQSPSSRPTGSPPPARDASPPRSSASRPRAAAPPGRPRRGGRPGRSHASRRPRAIPGAGRGSRRSAGAGSAANGRVSGSASSAALIQCMPCASGAPACGVPSEITWRTHPNPGVAALGALMARRARHQPAHRVADQGQRLHLAWPGVHESAPAGPPATARSPRYAGRCCSGPPRACNRGRGASASHTSPLGPRPPARRTRSPSGRARTPRPACAASGCAAASASRSSATGRPPARTLIGSCRSLPSRSRRVADQPVQGANEERSPARGRQPTARRSPRGAPARRRRRSRPGARRRPGRRTRRFEMASWSVRAGRAPRPLAWNARWATARWTSPMPPVALRSSSNPSPARLLSSSICRLSVIARTIRFAPDAARGAAGRRRLNLDVFAELSQRWAALSKAGQFAM